MPESGLKIYFTDQGLAQ